MSNCLFPWFSPHSNDEAPTPPTASSSSTNRSNKCHRRRSKSLVTIDGAGVLQIPLYRIIPRQQSKLLSYCWSQDWENVLIRCSTHLDEACHLTHHSHRTALHLATFIHACPLKVAQALLNVNRHMVLVQDAHRYTPLHNVALFEGESLVKVVCDTAIMVEQELDDKSKIPPISGTSPLFLAAKRAAPLRTLRQLLETRGRTEWIAPSTGAEPYWMNTLDEYSSPLEILLRTRAAVAWQLQPLPDGGVRSNILRPRLLWQMKLIANERLRVYRGIEQRDGSHGDDDDDDNDGKASSSSSSSTWDLPLVDNLDDITTEQEMQALSLWSKCIELLAEHVPRLLVNGDASMLGDEAPRYSHRQFAVVHCISAAKVPLANLLQVALMVYPEQALIRDEYGMLPLHHVLNARHPYATKCLVSMLLRHCPQMALVSCPCSTSGNRTTTTTMTTTTRPATSIKNATTPIALALNHGLPLDILKELLWADSDTTLITTTTAIAAATTAAAPSTTSASTSGVDSTTDLYPFALAASMGYDLDVIYTLLTAHPQVLQYYCHDDN